MTRKTSGQLFREKMYTKQNLKDLTMQMETRLTVPMKKIVTTQIDNNTWMKKLIEFYEEECGSNSDTNDNSSDNSSSSEEPSASESEASEESSSEEEE